MAARRPALAALVGLAHAAAFALTLATLAPGAQALEIRFRDTGAIPMSTLQLDAFSTAARYWENRLTDELTVYLDIGFGQLGANTLGSTFSERAIVDYATLRTRLLNDASSDADAIAVASLPPGQALAFVATHTDGSSYFDNDGSANNRLFSLTTANAKAVGLGTPTSATSPDARITFASAYAGSFAYERVGGGAPAGRYDFVSVAVHEIGHALGFISGVDDIDYCLDHAAQCGTAGGFDGSAWFSALDLFRHGAPGARNLAVGGSPYFSLDSGITALQSFATGVYHGNGAQAGHFGGAGTLMRATFSTGQVYEASDTDLLAFDAMGWNLAVPVPVPEPASAALLLAGLAVVGGALRRRRHALSASAAPGP